MPTIKYLMGRKALFHHPVLASVHTGSDGVMDYRAWVSLHLNGSEAEIFSMEKAQDITIPVIHLPIRCHVQWTHSLPNQ